MRPLLLSAVALALIALGTALWLGRPSRGGEQLERGVEPAVAQARPAAEPAAGGAPEEAQRTAVEVEAVASDSLPQAEELPALAGEDAVAAEGAFAELKVQVVSEEDGAPLAGVQIFRQPWPAPDQRDAFRWGATTDELGWATFETPAGGARIRASSQRDRELIVELAAGEQRAATLRLRARADLDFHLCIRSAATGEPVPGARVDVQDPAFEPFELDATKTALADERGCAQLRLPSWRAFTAEVSCAGYGPALLALEGAHAEREHALQVLLATGARLEGLVVDDAGAPLKGVEVTVEASGWDLSPKDPNRVLDGHGASFGNKQWTDKTREDGRYALDDLAPGVGLELELHHRARSVVQDYLRLEPGELAVRDFRVQELGSIQGVLLDSAGAPLEGQRVFLVEGSTPRLLRSYEDPFAFTHTRSHGAFSFWRVPPGTWLVGPALPRNPSVDAPLPLAQVVELPPGVPKVEVELRLPASLSVSGRCVGPDGEPAAGVALSSGDGSARGETAADGTFFLGPLPTGEIQLKTFATDQYAACDPLQLEAGNTDVIVRLARAGRIRGTVTDAESGASVPAEIWVSSLAGVPITFRLSNTDEGGVFDVTGLSAGSYALVARTSSGLVSPLHPLDVGAGEELSIELQVAAGGRARLLMPEGQFSVQVSVGGYLVDCLDLVGATTRPFPPGPFRIELATWGAILATREASAAAGEVVEVDLR